MVPGALTPSRASSISDGGQDCCGTPTPGATASKGWRESKGVRSTGVTRKYSESNFEMRNHRAGANLVNRRDASGVVPVVKEMRV